MTDGSRYQFAFSWDSPYGRAVRLVLRFASPGLVLDLGCGHAAVAEPLHRHGFTYVGIDREPVALAGIEQRGFEVHEADLGDVQGLNRRIRTFVDGRPVSAVLLLDALEHLPDRAGFLAALREAIDELGRPVMVISIPNVAHFDLGAKLLAGRWDVTPTGLLDETHLGFFTEERLTTALGAHGWTELASDDLHLFESDQHFPREHPVLASGTPLNDCLRSIRDSADGNGSINQFVRAYALGDHAEPAPATTTTTTTTAAASAAADSGRPFLTVLTRTQGERPASLIETLTCLAAQSCDDFEVVVLAHSSDRKGRTATEELVAMFPAAFANRVRVTGVTGGGRSRPLNAGIGLAKGHYLAFLDDDDVVTSDWIERFIEAATAHPGTVVRASCFVRVVRPPEGAEPKHLPVTLTKPYRAYPDRFDFISHLSENQSPNCSYAVPLGLCRFLGLRFNEDLDLYEDWDFLLRAAELGGVTDVGAITSIYQNCPEREGPGRQVDRDQWNAAERLIFAQMDARPLLLPTGSASRVGRPSIEGPGSGPAPAPPHLGTTDLVTSMEARVQQLTTELERARLAAATERAARKEVLESEFWRLTKPARSLLDWLKAKKPIGDLSVRTPLRRGRR